MLEAGRVRRADGARVTEADDVAHDDLRVDGLPLDPPPGSVILLHKPVGYVCSTTDVNPVIYELLPARFRARRPVMAPVGRLDLDSSGLLLVTDDGAFNHRMTSPRTHVAKVYDVTVAEPLHGAEAALFAEGTLMLKGETSPLRPASLEVVDAHHARITVTEGRYHQVRRMFAAAGNHVEALHRSAIGTLTLGTLAPGEWRVLEAEEVEALTRAASP